MTCLGKRFLISALAFTGTAALLAANAFAQESVPGDACTTAGLFRQSSGVSPANSGYTLFCDGTRWVGMIEYRSTGDLYFSSTGAVALPDGTTGQRPAIPVAGMIRYNVTLDTFEGYVDDGTPDWEDLLGGGGGSGAIDDLTDAATNYSSGNIYLGQNVGATTTTGTNNTAIGRSALDANTSGNNGAAFGANALGANNTGNNNTAFGSNAMLVNTNGDNNTVLGYAALEANTSGDSNIALGRSALNANTTGDGSVAIGQSALGVLTTGGTQNIALGYQAGDNLTTGDRNIIIGYDIDFSSATGNYQLNIGNTIYGDLATDYVGIGIATPSYDLSFGGDAAHTVAMENRTTAGNGNNFTIQAGGRGTGSNRNGGNLILSGGTASGDGYSEIEFQIVRAGQGSGSTNRTPQSIMTLWGDSANGTELEIDGDWVTLDLNSPNGATLARGGAEVMNFGNGNEVVIGGSTETYADIVTIEGVASQTADYFNITSDGGAAGDLLTFSSAGYLGIGNTSPNVALDVIGDIEYTGTIADVSDRRLKKDIQNLMTGQLAKVLKLQGVSFKMIEDAAGRTELGLIAQDVQPLFPELVQHSGSGTLSLNYSGLIAPMIEAMKEQQAQIDELKAMNAALVSRIDALEAARQ